MRLSARDRLSVVPTLEAAMTCPKCGKKISDQAPKCIWCGAATRDPVICPKCGKNVAIELDNCRFCASALWKLTAEQVWSVLGEALRAPGASHSQAPAVAEALETAGKLAAGGRHREAFASYDQAIRLDPHCSEAWVGKSATHILMQDMREGLACLDRAMHMQPGNTALREAMPALIAMKEESKRAMLGMSRAHAPQPAAAQVTPVVTDYPASASTDDPEDPNAEGQRHLGAGRIVEAIECFDCTLEDDPSDATALQGKATALTRLGRYRDAIECYEALLRIDSSDAATWCNIGLNLSKLGMFPEAVPAYDSALAIEPFNVAALSGKAEALARQGAAADALKLYDAALELAPNLHHAWTGKAETLLGEGRHADALACAEHALAIDLHDALANYVQARALDELGHQVEAKASYEQYLMHVDRKEEEDHARVRHSRERIQRIAEEALRIR